MKRRAAREGARAPINRANKKREMQKLLLAASVSAAALAIFHKKLVWAYRRRTSQVKLTYFNIAGLGEPIRYLLSQANVPFDDHRFGSRDEFLAMKPSLRFGQVPCLTIDGEEFFQSASIFRLLAKFFGATSLYPSDPRAAAIVDAFVDQVKDMDTGKLVASYKRRFGFPEEVLNDSNAEKVFECWRGETLPRHLSFFEAALKDSPTAWLTGSADPTIADIFLATTLNGYTTKWPQVEALYSAKLKALIAAVYALPAIVEFRQKEKLAAK